MKDYRLKDSKINDYITDVEIIKNNRRKNSDGVDTIAVRFADGRVFDNIVYNRENIEKIIKQQEAQAKEGLENIPVFEKRKTKAGRICAATTIGTSIGIGATAISSGVIEEPAVLVTGVGLVTLCALPSLCSYLKNSVILKELDKIKYRNEHLEELASYPNYEHALEGLDSNTVKYMQKLAEEEKNPFSIYRIDAYNKEDLEQIVGNIETEKAFQFTYKQKSTGASKK